MNKFDIKGYIESVLYILNKEGGLDYYTLFKVMYFAQRKFLADYGMTIFPDKFYALQYGPVPTLLYDAIRQSRPTPISADLSAVVIRGTDDASNMLIPMRDADKDAISLKAMETIDWAYKNYRNKSFHQLCNESHTGVWKDAFNSNDKEIHAIDIAREAGANEYNIANIISNEQFAAAYR